MPNHPSPATAPAPSRRRPRRAALITVAAAVLALSACGQSSGSASAGDTSGDVVRFGQLGTSKTLEALLAASGQDQDLDYTIEYSLFTAGPDFLEASKSGDVDLSVTADTPAIFAQASGVDVTVVAARKSVADGDAFVHLQVPSSSSITSLAGLKGKKVAYVQGTTTQYGLINALKQAGLTWADITPVNLGAGEVATALRNGDVDAAATLTSTYVQLDAEGFRDLAGTDLTENLSFVLVADTALASSAKSEHIGDLIVRLQAAADWQNEHQAEWAKTYADLTGQDEELATALVAADQAQHFTPIDDSLVAAQQEQADAFYEVGLLPEKLDVSEEFDTRYNEIVEAAA